MSQKKYIKKRAKNALYQFYCQIPYQFDIVSELVSKEFNLSFDDDVDVVDAICNSKVMSVELSVMSSQKIDHDALFYRPLQIKCIYDIDVLHLYWVYKPLCIKHIAKEI